MLKTKLASLFLFFIFAISCNPDNDVCTCSDLIGNTYQRDFDELNLTFMTSDTARIQQGVSIEKVKYTVESDNITDPEILCLVRFSRSTKLALFSVENFDCNSFNTSNDNIWSKQ